MVFQVVLIQGLKGYTVNILGIAGPTVSVAKAATGSPLRKEHGRVPRKLYLQNSQQALVCQPLF